LKNDGNVFNVNLLGNTTCLLPPSGILSRMRGRPTPIGQLLVASFVGKYELAAYGFVDLSGLS
jgi:hypothetical protein